MGNTADRSELVDFPNGRKIYPEVAEYLRTRTTSERDYQDALTKADRDYQDADVVLRRKAEDEGRAFDSYGRDREAHRAARAVRDAAYEAALNAKQAASADLLTKSEHREVRWIAEHCLFADQGSEVENYALAILKILPATVDEIWTEAKDNRGMCEVFDRFYEEADRDGVFTEGVQQAGYREMAAYRNFIRRQYGNSYVRDMQPHIDRILKAVRDDYDAKLATAKADWQRLDEAWRSERSRRGAATRAANAAGIVTSGSTSEAEDIQALRVAVTGHRTSHDAAGNTVLIPVYDPFGRAGSESEMVEL